MESGTSLYATILLLGAAHGLFLALALLNARGGNLAAHRMLALLTLAFALDLGKEYLWQAYDRPWAVLLGVGAVPLNLLYGPLTFLYIRALTSPGEFRLKGRQWLHFLPFAAGYAVLVPFLTLDAGFTSELLLQMRLNGDIELDGVNQALALLGLAVIVFGSVVQIGIYLLLSIRRLLRHARNVRNQFSYLEQVSLAWARNLLAGLSGLYLLYLADNFLSDALGLSGEFGRLLMVMMVVVIYAMGYLGLRQPAIFARLEGGSGEASTLEEITPARDEAGAPVREEPPKYRKSALDTALGKSLLAELEREMQGSKPYLDGDLTLPRLAGRLGISPNYLSQVINEQLGQNFFDYVNGYRIEEAKRLLVDTADKRVNVLNVALAAGFNSKSAFYTAFRKHTRMTPSQFRSSHLSP